MKNTILAILQEMKTLEDKLDVLTSIGLGTENTELFDICEEIRSDLVEKDSDLLW